MHLKFQTESSSLSTASGTGPVVTREREAKKPRCFFMFLAHSTNVMLYVRVAIGEQSYHICCQVNSEGQE